MVFGTTLTEGSRTVRTGAVSPIGDLVSASPLSTADSYRSDILCHESPPPFTKIHASTLM